VAAAIDARALAVPHREDAIDVRAFVHRDLLRAPHRRRGEILVQPRLELDARAIEELLRLPERLVESAERRAAVAGYEAAGVEPGRVVALSLQQQKAYERLHAGQEDAAAAKLVLVIEGDVAKRRGRDRSGQGHRRQAPRIVFRIAPRRVAAAS